MSNYALSSEDQRKLWLAVIVEARLRWPAGHRRRMEVFHAAVAGILRASDHTTRVDKIKPGRAEGVLLGAAEAVGAAFPEPGYSEAVALRPPAFD